ncbi:major facilitator superfamily domain-containing protein [Elsinoe ampelina]|uniref:Major facilitator superfamily domain-containing protein n=1 Tax=Elsinoe ampelina TaxID=302913 RepID=A0A6A6GR33_9PEZI|nr:major facilitator superfamily domain-containing protein [Elsinoe ampelina]
MHNAIRYASKTTAAEEDGHCQQPQCVPTGEVVVSPLHRTCFPSSGQLDASVKLPRCRHVGVHVHASSRGQFPTLAQFLLRSLAAAGDHSAHGANARGLSRCDTTPHPGHLQTKICDLSVYQLNACLALDCMRGFMVHFQPLDIKSVAPLVLRGCSEVGIRFHSIAVRLLIILPRSTMAEATRASSITTDVKGTPSTNQSINNDTYPTNPQSSLLTSVKKFLNKKDNFAEEPPNGGLTAWLQVFGCFLVFMNNWGLACSFGVYQAYYQLPTSTPNLISHSPTSISWIGTTQASLTLLVGVASGPLFDRGYFFPTLVLASLLLSLTFMLLSLSTTYYQILLTQGILQGISSGLLYIPSVAQIPQYFTTHRGLALGIVTAGAPFGGIIYPLLFRHLITTYTFPWATRTLGFLSLALLAISWLVIKPLRLRNAVKKQLRDPSALRDPPYLTFLAASFLLFCGMMTPYILSATYSFTRISGLTPSSLANQTSLPAAAQAHVLHATDTAFSTVPIINAANFLGRVIPAAVSDLGVGPELMLLACSLALSGLGFAWIAVRDRAAYVAFLVLWGFFSGGVAALPAAALPYICPRMEVFATRLGLVYCAAGLGVLVGTPVGTAIDALFEGEGGRAFLGSQVWVGATMVVGAGFVAHSAWFIREKRVVVWRERRERERAAKGEGRVEVEDKA